MVLFLWCIPTYGTNLMRYFKQAVFPLSESTRLWRHKWRLEFLGCVCSRGGNFKREGCRICDVRNCGICCVICMALTERQTCSFYCWNMSGMLTCLNCGRIQTLQSFATMFAHKFLDSVVFLTLWFVSFLLLIVQWFVLMSQLLILLLDELMQGNYAFTVLCCDDLFLGSMLPLHALECLSSCSAIRKVSLKTAVTISAFLVSRFSAGLIHVSFTLAV